jgi:hypothetical protein
MYNFRGHKRSLDILELGALPHFTRGLAEQFGLWFLLMQYGSNLQYCCLPVVILIFTVIHQLHDLVFCKIIRHQIAF